MNRIPYCILLSLYVTRQRTILQDEVVAREQKKLRLGLNP